jgi:hypothetical protein
LLQPWGCGAFLLTTHPPSWYYSPAKKPAKSWVCFV